MEKKRTRKPYTAIEKVYASLYSNSSENDYYKGKKPTMKELADFLGRPEGSITHLILVTKTEALQGIILRDYEESQDKNEDDE